MIDIILFVKTFDKYHNPVNGHVVRCLDLLDAIESVSGNHLETAIATSKEEYESLSARYKSAVHVIDRGENVIHVVSEKTVILTDGVLLYTSGYNPRIVNAVDEKMETNHYPKEMFSGFQYAIVSGLTKGYSYEGGSEVLVVAGGNKDEFSRTYNRTVRQKIKEAGLPTRFIEDMGRLDLFKLACKSLFVVCTPSTVSLEMIAMGVPFIFLQTAEDQYAYATTYDKYGIVSESSSGEEIDAFIDSPKSPPDIVNRDHIYKLAQSIWKMTQENE